MREQILFHASLLLVRLGHAGSTLLEVRDDSVCEGNPQYSQCGGDYPPEWCCRRSTTCLPVNSTTTTVVLCCPDGNDCASFLPIPCDISHGSLSDVHILGEPPQLTPCGDSCCPPGYNCTSDLCTIEPSLGLIPASLPRSAEEKTYGGGVGVGVGIGIAVTVGIVAMGCLIWMGVRRRHKRTAISKSMISRPHPKPEEGPGMDEQACLFEQGGQSRRMDQFHRSEAWRSSSELTPAPLMQRNTNEHPRMPLERDHDERRPMAKDLPPYPSESRDDKVRPPPAPGLHPARQLKNNDTASSLYEVSPYGSEHVQRRG